MSDDIRTGRKARKILTIMAAVFAVALMMAVPLFVAIDSDADLTKDDAGYCITLTNPSDDQFAKLGTSKASSLLDALSSDLRIINTELYGAPTATADSFERTMARGDKITDNSEISITTENINGQNVKITLTAVANGKLIETDKSGWTEQMKKAAEAISTYIGADIHIGDKIEITGTIKEETSSQTEIKYKLLDGSKCIPEKSTVSSYGVADTDVNIKVTFASSGTSKDIQLVSSIKGVFGYEYTREFKDSDVKVGTKYDYKYSTDLTYSGDTYFKVDGKEYTLISEDEDVPPSGEGTVGQYEITNQSSVKISSYFKEEVESLPASEDGMKVEKTYAAAESAFDNVVMDAVGNDLLKLILIIVGIVVGIIVIIVILIIVLVVLKKKKKKQ